MRKYVIVALMLLAFCDPASSQSTAPAQGSVAPQNPAHFFGVGVGFQSASTPQLSGWANICTKGSETVYACGATDLIGGVTSVRAGIETIVLKQGPIIVTLKGDAGIATGANASTGGSYSGGGSFLLNISKLIKVDNSYFVASITYLKSNVAQQSPTVAGALSAFGSQATFRFGFGRSF